MQQPKKLSPSFKIWLKKDGSHVMGEGGASLLKAIHRCGSITEAAKQVGVSYKYAWDRLAEMGRGLGEPVLRTRRGGKKGGGGAELTEAAVQLLRNYERTTRYLGRVLKDDIYWEAIGLRISARNCLQGTVEEVEDGPVVSKVKIRVQAPMVITAVITKEAVEDLAIKPGDRVGAVIKATEVMVAKE
ncbi:MAG: TOBE domain-containing protein [archaeon]